MLSKEMMKLFLSLKKRTSNSIHQYIHHSILLFIHPAVPLFVHSYADILHSSYNRQSHLHSKDNMLPSDPY